MHLTLAFEELILIISGDLTKDSSQDSLVYFYILVFRWQAMILGPVSTKHSQKTVSQITYPPLFILIKFVSLVDSVMMI